MRCVVELECGIMWQEQGARHTKHTRKAHTTHTTHTINYKQGTHIMAQDLMTDEEFELFAQSSATKGACVINLKTQNISKSARQALEGTPFKSLQKQHLNGTIVKEYYASPRVKAKLDDIAKTHGITIVA